MSLAVGPIEDAILAQLRLLPYDVFDDVVPDDATPYTYPDGQVRAYLNVYFGGPRESASGKGICGVRFNTNVANCTVQVSSTNRSFVRRAVDKVTDSLVGFVPTDDSGEINLMGSVSYRVASTSAKPTLYITDVAFDYICNLTTT